MEVLLRYLDACRPQKKNILEKKLLIKRTNFLKERKIIDAFENGFFFNYLKRYHHFKEKIKTKTKNFFSQKKLIIKKKKSINKELFKKHFKFKNLIDMQREMYKTKNRNKNKSLGNVIKSRLDI